MNIYPNDVRKGRIAMNRLLKTPVPEKVSEPAQRDTSGQVHELENLTLQ